MTEIATIEDLMKIKPKQEILYHRGYLINDCDSRKGGDTQAFIKRKKVWKMYCDGLIELVQKKILNADSLSRDPIFEYYAVGRVDRTQKRVMFDGISNKSGKR